MSRPANTKLIDKNTACECGHIAGHHRTELPKPCRLCTCEGFITAKDRGMLLDEPVRPHEAELAMTSSELETAEHHERLNERDRQRAEE